MFKFRQPSICSDLDIVSDSDSVSDVAEEIQKGVSINSISEPRTTLGSADSEHKSKRNSIVDGDSGLTGNERIETDGECSQNHEVDSCSESASFCLVDGTAGLTSDKNGGGPSVTATAIMCDRKRKERHESCSQGQEKKVIRSLSHPKVEAGGDKSANDFRRTQSNDSFQTNKSSSPPPSPPTTGAEEDENSNELLTKQVCRSGMQVNGHAEQNNQVSSTSSAVDSSSYGVGSRPIPVQSSNVRNMPQYFEAELQRQWERSAQWNSNGNRKGHSSSRKHRSSRSGKPSEVSTKNKLPTEEKKDDRRDSDELLEENIIFANKEDDLTPTSDESSSSIESLEEVEDNGNKLVISPTSSCEDIETDVVEDPIVAYEKETTSTNRNHPSLGSENSLEPLPHVDLNFANLHHQVGTNEPISFLAALHTSRIEDQVMLSPRNSTLLLKDVIDPNMPPSPPLYQAPLDPPISRQHGGNQNMKMNQLSRQISNLKKHLKTLEDEHEQLFGYKPSHADKLNHKEMRKCLLHLTKAKREMKQMREDPANVRIGGNLLQVMNAGQVLYSRNSAEALKSLDETVREITKTLSDKRRAQCRPEDPALMNPAELNEEKSDMQKQLLMLEKRHGRPSSKEEKDIVRSLYDRYRSLKKSGGGARLGSIKENSIDLAPILEYEPLELTQQNEVEGGNNASIVELRRDSLPASSSTNSPKGRRRRIIPSGEDGDDGDCSIVNFGNEGFTEMSLVELEASQKSAREEKRRLRVMLRKFEYDFQNATGRLPQKDEKYSTIEMESIYQKYKRRRATVRLLDVLITKQRAIESGG